MKKILILLLLFVVATQKGFGQYIAEGNWHQGKVLLDTGDSLMGNIKFNLKEELLLVNNAQGLQTLSSRKVAMFSFFDIKEKKERQFYTLMYPKTNNYKTPCFFEILHHGDKITLIGRESLVQTTSTTRGYYGGYYGNPMNMPISITSVKTDMFFLYNSGKVKSFGGSKNSLYELLSDAQTQIKAYIKENKPNLEKPEDVKRLLLYYHQLKK